MFSEDVTDGVTEFDVIFGVTASDVIFGVSIETLDVVPLPVVPYPCLFSASDNRLTCSVVLLPLRDISTLHNGHVLFHFCNHSSTQTG